MSTIVFTAILWKGGNKLEAESWMKNALLLAKKAELLDEVPIGCIIVKDDKIIAAAYNKRELENKSTAHAEILAIEEACKKLKSWRLEDCDLYVTLEPCPMCAGAIIQSRIRNVYFGAYDFKGGCFGSLIDFTNIKGFNHYPNVKGGVLENECASILSNFFRKKRLEKKKQKKVNSSIH